MNYTLTMTPENRQKAITEGLREFLDEIHVEKALTLWIQKYADKPTFALNHFVSECCKLFSLGNIRKEMVEVLIREMAAQKYPAIQTAVSAPLENEKDKALQVFQLIISHICSIAGFEDGKGIRNYVITNLDRIPLDKSTRSEVRLWLSGKLNEIETAIPINSMKLMINLAYVGLCEYCGPVKADYILHDAVKQTAKTTRAAGFDPEKLL